MRIFRLTSCVCLFPALHVKHRAVQDLSPDLADEAFAIAVSNSGKFVATGGSQQLLKLWNVEGLKLVATCTGHSGTIRNIKFSPDDRQVVTVGDDGIVLVWNLYE